tara:strand:+ start:4182 stop:4814 length:633 start_codon:yes stop_codon:yes gene_type:complete
MTNFTISIFGNKTFLEIIKELNLFPGSKLSNLDNINLCKKDESSNQIIFFFMSNNKKDLLRIIDKKIPIILFGPSNKSFNEYSEKFIEHMVMPFKILSLKKKAISLLAKHQFKLGSVINLRDYIIDKYERKIKKNNIELQLTEKETNFLILFSNSKEPLSKNFVLKNVWKYSLESDTHTVETHIHRLRKKILEKFNDDKFIKNNDKGYYV